MQYQKHYPRILLLIFLLVAISIGYLITPDYGLSWDELGIYAHARQTLDAYKYIFHPWDYEAPISEALLHLYGPSHFMLSTLFSQFVFNINKSWTYYDAYHFFYFLTFLVGVTILYFLSKRWVSEWTALILSVLFASQPLLWGNAFINPKDIPFMVFFMASVYFGFEMMDSQSNSSWWKILWASMILGFTTSIRSIAPMAGILVILYGFLKHSKKIIPIIPIYTGFTIIFTYLTWPYLWSSPIRHFFESFVTMSKYPMTFNALFMGNIYQVNQMPFYYFPVFSAIQLTEPLLILIFTGSFLSLKQFIKGEKKEPIILIMVWFFVPFLIVVLLGSTLYDNARQMMFLLPPLFILAGIGLDAILKYATSPILKGVFIVTIIFPGLYACIRLHPYQYIYYNTSVGGVEGAFRKFDLDYSGTSYKEAMKYINENAEKNTQIVVFGPRHLTRVYIRPVLKETITGEFDPINPNGSEYYYVLLLTRGNADMNVCVNGEIVYSIERDGGVLAYIRKVYSNEPCW